METTPKVYHFAKCHATKNATDYELTHENDRATFITDTVRIERFMGYSNAYNLGEYFRLRNTTNWSKCEKVTGLWKTPTQEVYFGDYRTTATKTLILFVFGPFRASLTVTVFPEGYYPHRNEIERLAGQYRARESENETGAE
jgi:hypothetical protein